MLKNISITAYKNNRQLEILFDDDGPKKLPERNTREL